MSGADPAQVSGLGSGNHFLEVQAVEEIADPEVAGAYGLWEGQEGAAYFAAITAAANYRPQQQADKGTHPGNPRLRARARRLARQPGRAAEQPQRDPLHADPIAPRHLNLGALV